MPCLNEGKFIENSVQQPLALDYPPDRYSLFVVDGMSTDGTREILTRLAAVARFRISRFRHSYRKLLASCYSLKLLHFVDLSLAATRYDFIAARNAG